jgi:hypothetical protein
MKKILSNINRINWCGSTTISGTFTLSFRGSNREIGSMFDGGSAV